MNRDWRSGLRRDRLGNWERAGQWHSKCTWSSGPEPHSLQVGSRLVKVELRLVELKRQTSDSRPWHPTSRQITVQPHQLWVTSCHQPMWDRFAELDKFAF